jgi:hypothetical protein
MQQEPSRSRRGMRVFTGQIGNRPFYKKLSKYIIAALKLTSSSFIV